VKGGVQVSNVTKQNVISYDEVKDSHFSTKSKISEPENKKTKLEEVHDDEYQKKLFTAAQERSHTPILYNILVYNRPA